MHRRFTIFALFATVALLSPTTFAAGVSVVEASPQQKSQARTAYKKGRAAIEAKRYQAALKHFRASYDVVASPNSHMYIVVALQGLGRLSEAYWEAKRTVFEAKQAALVDKKYKKAQQKAEESLRAIERNNAIVELVSDKASNDAVFINGKRLSDEQRQRPLVMKPGMVAIRYGNRSALKLSTRAGQRYPIRLQGNASPAALPNRPAGNDNSDSDSNAKGSDHKLLWPGVLVAGVGGLGLVFAAAFGGTAQGIHSDLEAACPSRPCGGDQQETIDRGQRFQTASNISLTLGLIAVATGGTLIAFDLWGTPKKAGKDKTSARVSSRGSLHMGPTQLKLGVQF